MMITSTEQHPESIHNPPEVQNQEIEDVDVEEVVGDEIQSEIAVVDGEEIILTEDDEYIEYDAIVNLSNERNLLFDMYQPHQTENGSYVCKICLRTGKNTEYPDRPTFVAHRYKCHGSFNNNVICPMEDCREVYASLYTLRRHLGTQHDLPIEIHLQSFTNIGEFEKFRHLVELASGCQYMMHTKQPKYRRQVMHCSKSEHKLVLQTQKHRLPRERMVKEGSACPSTISYTVEPTNGEVHAYMQLYHCGHTPDTDLLYISNADNARPMDIIFPIKPACWAGQPMQYVQIDVHEMLPSIYGNKMYEHVLMVTCLKTRFLWAKPLMECTRTTIGRVLNSIFNEYGVPEGFSTTFCPTYIRDTMKSLESVYAVEIREIWNEPISYADLERWVLELSQHELGTRNRWVEQMQFVVMEYNQKPLPERPETPFERMFNRKAPNLYHNGDHQDLMVAKCRIYHSELRREEEGVEANLSTASFHIGVKVFLRKGITKPRRGNNTQFYFGYIAEVDHSNPYYPFKVHYSSTDSPWPCERNLCAWVSVFDLLPTIHQISNMSIRQKQESIANLLCSCDGVESNKNYDMSAIGRIARESSSCLLFRNMLCTNEMSKSCCKLVGQEQCEYHAMYPEHDESYTKMDLVLKAFFAQNDLRKKRDKGMQEPTPFQRRLRAEMQRRRHTTAQVNDDDGGDIEELAPHCLEPVEHTENSGQQVDHQNIHDPQQIPIEDSSERIDIEEINEEILEPAGSLEESHSKDVLFEYDDIKQTSTSLLKRGKRRKSPIDTTKRKKTSESEEFSPSTPSSSSTPSTSVSLSAARRLSARRTIRPKNLEDYVE